MAGKIELERALEQRCVDKIEARGGLALKLRPPTGKGFPDRTVLMPPMVHMTSKGPLNFDRPGAVKMPTIPSGNGVFFCEFKRQKTGVESTQQATWRRMLTLLGFGVYLVETDAQFDEALERELSR